MRKSPGQDLPWRDTATVVAVTALSIAISIRFDLNETVYAVTRRGERLQIDELWIGVLVLLISLMWLAWRRFREARRELRARQAAEARLEALLGENRELAQENLRIQEAERKYLARELHDELGQYLNSIKLDAVSICKHGAADGRIAMLASRSIIGAVDHVHEVVSDMIARLRPVGLDELGLVAAIEHCVDEWRPRLPETHFELSVLGQFEDLSETVSLTMFRLVQEGLTNIYKHAHAGRAQIILERHEAAGGLRLIVADNGRGMQSNGRSARFGLRGMRERVEIEGGTFIIESGPGRGLRFEALLLDR